MSFQNVLRKYREMAFSERDKGERFERLMQAFLLTSPLYQFEKVWMWDEFPEREQFGWVDVGIDRHDKAISNGLKEPFWVSDCLWKLTNHGHTCFTELAPDKSGGGVP